MALRSFRSISGRLPIGLPGLSNRIRPSLSTTRLHRHQAGQDQGRCHRAPQLSERSGRYAHGYREARLVLLLSRIALLHRWWRGCRGDGVRASVRPPRPGPIIAIAFRNGALLPMHACSVWNRRASLPARIRRLLRETLINQNAVLG